MIEQLFGSKTRVKLLQLFLSNPNRSFYVREITRKIDEQINSVRRELSNLLNIGIITSDSAENRLYYEVNQKYPHYQPLRSIFANTGSARGDAGTPKVVSAKPLKETVLPLPAPNEPSVKSEGQHTSLSPLSLLPGSSVVILTGQFTRDNSAGVDVVLVGNLQPTAISKAIESLEQQERKELRYVVFTQEELTYRLKIHDRFIIGVLDSKHIVELDKQNTLAQFSHHI